MTRFIIPILVALAIVGAAGSGWEKDGTLVSPLQAKNLFEDSFSEGESNEIKYQGKLAATSLEMLDNLKKLMLLGQMEKGDCSPAVEIEGKAKGGDKESQWFLADLFRQGLCVRQSDEATVHWLWAAAKQGHVPSKFELGLSYVEGKGVKRDSQRAAKLFEEASSGGNEASTVQLAKLYSIGDGVPRSKIKAISLLKNAISQGYEEAAIQLGLIYINESAKNSDIEEALKVVLPLAKKGRPRAQLLANMALSLLAIENDAIVNTEALIEAHKWANLALTAQDKKLAKLALSRLEAIDSALDPSQIAEAERRASEWKPVQDEPRASPKKKLTKLPDIPDIIPEEMGEEEALLKLKSLDIPIDKETFFLAARTDNLGVFKLFHRAGANLETTWGIARITPLYRAADYGSQKVVSYLINEGANVNASSEDDGMSPLLRAIAHKEKKIIDDLLDAGADPKQDSRFSGGISEGKGSSIFAGASPLSYAVGFDDPALVKRLLKLGASPNEIYSWHQTPLMKAKAANPEIFSTLINAGTNIMAVDDWGQTVLHHIVEAKPIQLDNLRLALKAGADPNPSVIPTTPLLLAVYLGNAKAVELLAMAGANLNEHYSIEAEKMPTAFNNETRRIIMNGGTPLILAAQLGNASVVEVLLRHGADKEAYITLKNKRITVMDIAKDADNQLVMKLLGKSLDK